MESLSPPIRKALALAILFLVIAGFYVGLVQPLIDEYAATEASIDKLRNELTHYRRAGGELSQRRAELATLKQRQSGPDGFLQGSNDTLVAAQIQNRIKALTDTAAGELKSTQVLPPQDQGKRRRITVRGEMSTTIAGALRLFHGLESASPYLFVDNAAFRSRIGPTRNRGNVETSDIIDLQFDVYGYTHAKN